MGNTSEDILEAALSLPKRERMRIARNLLESIEDESGPDAGWDQAWRVETERRVAEARDGTVKLEDPAVVLKDLRSQLAARRKKDTTAAGPRSTKKPHRRAR